MTKQTAPDLTVVALRLGGIVRYQYNVNGRIAGDYPTRERAEAAIERFVNRDKMRADFAAKLAAR